MCYYALGSCIFVIVLSIIRLYYQYRYGNELD